MEKYDIAIIGAGPGGYVAAIRAAQLGFSTVCIDQRISLGGTCLNVGCIPSKTLLSTTEQLFHLQHGGGERGLEFSDLSINFKKLMSNKNQVVKSLVDGISGLFKKNKIIALQGKAEFIDPHRLRIVHKDKDPMEIEAFHIIIATGSESIPLRDLPFDERQVVSSTGALSLNNIPKSLIVIGGGVIGVELASVYQRLGSQVTIVEMMDRICPTLDHQLSNKLLQELKKQGIQFKLSTQVISSIVQPNEVILTINEENELKNLSAEVALVAIGRRPYTKELQLEKIGIHLDAKGFVAVDENLRTKYSHIYAIGDVVSGMMLAHRASAEGVAVIEFIKGIKSNVNYLAIPNVVYTYPEVASVGLSEQECRELGLEILIGTSAFKGNARARCTNETEGFVKIIGEKKSGRMVGMHILGAHASELISDGMMAIETGLKIEEIANLPYAHPTLGESIKEAALDALGRPIHH